MQRQRDIKDHGVFVDLQIIESGWRIMCIYACVCVGVYFREKVAGDEHGEVERDQNMKVLLRGSLTCWIFGTEIWKHSLLRASISLTGGEANLKLQKSNQIN